MDLFASLSQQLPETEIALLAEAMEEDPTHCLLLNHEKITDERFLSLYPHVEPHPLVPHAFYYEKSEYDFGKSFLYDVGAISIQDGSAMLVPFLLAPLQDDIVLDLCAAPGGKTIAMSLIMGNHGLILSNDISFPRAHDLSQNIERMGRGNVIVNSSDSEFVHPYLKETFDKILLDVPCSGSAMFRKNALSEKDWSQAKVARCAKTQRKLLDHAASMLKPGGTIMYSTCSFSYEENEGNLLSFLDAHPEFEAAPLPLDHPGFYHSSALPEAIYLFPHRFRGEGQFACLLRKKGAHEPSSLAPKSALIARKYRDFLSQYGLERRSNEEKRGKFYSLTLAFDTGHLNTLRYGVKLFEMRETFLPDHALARYLGNEFSIPLEEKEARLFLHGDVFPLDKPDGFFVVSYAGFNLGWVKVTKGQAKNHYPKGLRHTYPGALL